MNFSSSIIIFVRHEKANIMSANNPLKAMGSKLWLQTKITYLKMRFAATGMMKI